MSKEIPSKNIWTNEVKQKIFELLQENPTKNPISAVRFFSMEQIANELNKFFNTKKFNRRKVLDFCRDNKPFFLKKGFDLDLRNRNANAYGSRLNKPPAPNETISKKHNRMIHSIFKKK